MMLLARCILVVACLCSWVVTLGQQVSSVRSGKHSDSSLWRGGAPIGCNWGEKQTVSVAHTISVDCSQLQVFGESQVVVRKGGLLLINGDLEIFGKAIFTIEAGASMIVNGDVNVAGSAVVTVDGQLTVAGTAVATGSGKVCGAGSSEVHGALRGEGWCLSLVTLARLPFGMSAALTDGQDVVLAWRFQAASASDEFVISRSNDGIAYTEIGKVPAVWSQRQHDYQFLDPARGDGTTYYKLELRRNGALRDGLSEIVPVALKNNEQSGACEIILNPNPCVPWCEARIADCPEGAFNTSILDIGGNLVSVLVAESTSSSSNIIYHINRDNFLVPGVYIIRSEGRETRLQKKLIVR